MNSPSLSITVRTYGASSLLEFVLPVIGSDNFFVCFLVDAIDLCQILPFFVFNSSSPVFISVRRLSWSCRNQKGRTKTNKVAMHAGWFHADKIAGIQLTPIDGAWFQTGVHTPQDPVFSFFLLYDGHRVTLYTLSMNRFFVVVVVVLSPSLNQTIKIPHFDFLYSPYVPQREQVLRCMSTSTWRRNKGRVLFFEIYLEGL